MNEARSKEREDMVTGVPLAFIWVLSHQGLLG